MGWDLRIDGRLITAGQEPHARLDGTTDLSVPDARYALVLRGSSGTAYVDQGSGWEFLFAYDTAEVLDSVTRGAGAVALRLRRTPGLRHPHRRRAGGAARPLRLSLNHAAPGNATRYDRTGSISWFREGMWLTTSRRGFGWVGTAPESRDRTEPDPLRRDMVTGGAQPRRSWVTDRSPRRHRPGRET